MTELRVLDGRNPHDISEIKKITDYEVIAECNDFFGGNHVMCLRIDGKYVPAHRVWNHPQFDWILCAEYKTFRGFAEWVKCFL